MDNKQILNKVIFYYCCHTFWQGAHIWGVNAQEWLYLDRLFSWVQNLEFGIDCDSRVALVGPNGAGILLLPYPSALMAWPRSL
jgi:ABC-type uncharacterized transport system ATPase subunit